MQSLQFFIGKGGVGKTTAASSYAVWAATQRPRGSVLLMSTDPAHSLADVFGLSFRAEKHRVQLPTPGTLELWQIDPDRRFGNFLAQHRQAILTIVEGSTFFRRWEIEPLLDTTLPGLAEVSALLALADLRESGTYDEIVVDTAPMGHTLRLFEFPQHFANFLHFLEIASAGQEWSGGRPAQGGTALTRLLEGWRAAVEGIVSALSGPARMVLVTTPEQFALQESVRASAALAASSPPLRFHSVVINRTVASAGTCSWCTARLARTSEAMRFVAQHFPDIPVMTAEDTGAPVVGAEALLSLGKHVFEGAPLRIELEPAAVPDIELKPAEWPRLETPLSLTIGKGGVGKTTISAGLAYQTRRVAPAVTVTICSTDPAPSLDDVFRQPVGDRPAPVLEDRRLRAAEFDAAAHFRTWATRAKRKMNDALNREASRVHLDLGFERQLFSALLDIVPPGMDELLATFRVLEMVSAASGLVLIDMAPTGHALELLRMPERILHWARLLLKTLAPHGTLPPVRDLSAEVTEIGQQARELAGLLKDASRARVHPVMLPEPLPDRETGRLLRSLEELHVPTAPVFVNRALVMNDTGDCRRCALARRWQMATLAKVRRQHGRVFVVRNHEDEIAGAAGLKSLTSELWRL